jgi:hypothetical protein
MSNVFEEARLALESLTEDELKIFAEKMMGMKNSSYEEFYGQLAYSIRTAKIVIAMVDEMKAKR